MAAETERTIKDGNDFNLLDFTPLEGNLGRKQGEKER